MSETFTYVFDDNGTPIDLTVTVSTPATNSSGFGLGYAVTAITGDIGGVVIDGEVGTGGASQTSNNATFDNTIFTSDNSGAENIGTPSSSSGIDIDGLEFTAGGIEYNVYYDSGFNLVEVTGTVTNTAIALVSSDAPCYCPGTLILTERGEVPVEDLRIGDTIKTASGQHRPIKWIGSRSYTGRFLATSPTMQPIRFCAGSLGDGLPRRDLLVSPKHAMFLDGVLVPAERLVNGVTVVVDGTVTEVAYFHVELETHDVLLAEGAPSESFIDDNSRGMFHNAHEHAALFPDHKRVPAIYCAPRVENGEQLNRIKCAIDLRAGLTVPGIGEPLRGHVDGWDGNTLQGWAQNPDKAEAPVCLEVLADGRVVARVLANLFRTDLRAAGLGSGCHGFRMRLPARARRGTVEVRRAIDGAMLSALGYETRARKAS